MILLLLLAISLATSLCIPLPFFMQAKNTTSEEDDVCDLTQPSTPPTTLPPQEQSHEDEVTKEAMEEESGELATKRKKVRPNTPPTPLNPPSPPTPPTPSPPPTPSTPTLPFPVLSDDIDDDDDDDILSNPFESPISKHASPDENDIEKEDTKQKKVSQDKEEGKKKGEGEEAEEGEEPRVGGEEDQRVLRPRKDAIPTSSHPPACLLKPVVVVHPISIDLLPDLPPGWQTISKQRKRGTMKGRKDRYWISEDGVKYNSLVKVKAALSRLNR